MSLVARAASLALVISACTATPAATPSPSPSATQGATAVAASPTPAATGSSLPPGTFENRTLGYRISLPLAYRLSGSRIVRGQPEVLGQDTYTTTTEAQAPRGMSPGPR